MFKVYLIWVFIYIEREREGLEENKKKRKKVIYKENRDKYSRK